jgi:uncharacterized protein YgiM (DUF1202 family)
MKYTHILLIPLALASLVSCLATHIETSVTPSAASATYSPEVSTETAMLDEIESGEAYELKTDSQPLKAILCVTAIEAVHLRTEPNAKAIVINWLRAGTQVTAKASAEGWTYAQVGEQSGYIKSEFLGECAK